MSRNTYVVDAHAHPPRKGIPGLDNRPYSPPQNLEDVERFFLRDLEELLSDMERLGTDAKIMLSMPDDIEDQFHFGEHTVAGIKTLTTLEWILKAKELHPKKFYGVACLNPLLPDSVGRLDDLVKNHAFRGAKLHQAHNNFFANDRRVYPFYQKCQDLDVPVLFHTGFPPERDIDRYIPSMPHYLDELANDFPGLQIVMCHTGGNWYQDGVMIAQRNPNIVVDISSIPQMAQRMVCPLVDDRQLVRRIVELIGADRVMYGTDNFDEETNFSYMETIGISHADLRKVMGENAKRIFRLD